MSEQDVDKYIREELNLRWPEFAREWGIEWYRVTHLRQFGISIIVELLTMAFDIYYRAFETSQGIGNKQGKSRVENMHSLIKDISNFCFRYSGVLITNKTEIFWEMKWNQMFN